MTLYEICYWQNNPNGQFEISMGCVDSLERAKAQLPNNCHIVPREVSNAEYNAMCEAGEIF